MRKGVKYLMRNHESAEEIPQHVEGGGYNGGHVVVGCYGSGHHAVKGEIQHSEVHKKYVPHEL